MMIRKIGIEEKSDTLSATSLRTNLHQKANIKEAVPESETASKIDIRIDYSITNVSVLRLA